MKKTNHLNRYPLNGNYANHKEILLQQQIAKAMEEGWRLIMLTSKAGLESTICQMFCKCFS